MSLLSPIQLAVLGGDLGLLRELETIPGTNLSIRPQGSIVPNASLLHLAMLSKAPSSTKQQIVRCLLDRVPSLVHARDQWGFTPLHYAVSAGDDVTLVSMLLQAGADISVTSENGSTALTLAKQLNRRSTLDLLTTQARAHEDKNATVLLLWLEALCVSEYFEQFLAAGYDMQLIRQEGLTDEDLDCVGVPSTKLGSRKKLKTLFRFHEFYILCNNNNNNDNDNENNDNSDDDKEEDNEESESGSDNEDEEEGEEESDEEEEEEEESSSDEEDE